MNISPIAQWFLLDLPVHKKQLFSILLVALVPSRIVQQDRSGQDYVYTFEGKGVQRVKKIELKLGAFYDGFVEVVSGLDSSIVLIDKGSKSIQADDAIEIK